MNYDNSIIINENLYKDMHDISTKNLDNHHHTAKNDDINELKSNYAEMKTSMHSMQKIIDHIPNDMLEIKKMHKDLIRANSTVANTSVELRNHHHDALCTKSVKMCGDGIFQDSSLTIALNDYEDSFVAQHAYCEKIENDGIGIAYLPDYITQSNNALIPGVETEVASTSSSIMNSKKIEMADMHVRLPIGKRLNHILMNKTHDALEWIKSNLKSVFGQQIDQAFFYHADDINTKLDYVNNPGVQSIFTGITNENNIDVNYEDLPNTLMHILNQMIIKLYSSNIRPENPIWIMSPKMYSSIRQIKDKNGNFIFNSYNELFGYKVHMHHLLSMTNIHKEYIVLSDLKQCYTYFEQEDLTCKLGHNPHSRDAEYFVHKSCAGTIFNKSMIQYCCIKNVENTAIFDFNK